MPELAISLLGPFSVRIGELTLDTFRSRAPAALLIILAAEARALSREWLIELLWPEMPVTTGRKNLRQTLYELRQAIPKLEQTADRKRGSPRSLVLADRQTIKLDDAANYQVDTARFSALLAQGEIDDLRQAVTLYQGDFLADFYLPNSSAFEDWAAAKRALFRRLAIDAMDRLAQDDLRQGNYAKAADLARRQLEVDSLRETAVQQLMIALTLSGRRSAALAQYEQSRDELVQELGVEPEPATQKIYERIASGELHAAGDDILGLLQPTVEALSPRAMPAQTHSDARRHNLPAEPTPFVGREQEVADVIELAIDPSCRLLTILGPGGCGKSRLAIRATRQLMQDQPDAFPDGLWYVSLTEPAGADRLIAAVVDGLPFKAFDPAKDLHAQLFSYLQGQEMLLLLDNMEYAATLEGSQFLSDLLANAPGVSLLACSRTRLKLHAEQLFPIGGLDIPEEPGVSPEAARDYSAMQLFANSARQVRPDFDLSDDNIDATLAICRQLQGIPLAIELAASWIEVMPPVEIAAEVARSLDFLETDWVDVPERQRSLRVIFEASWRLLNGQERAAFLRLAVFRGGFDYEAARQIADVGRRTLLNLINKSWLRRDESGRYLAHEMLRQYAYQQLSEDDMAMESAHERHSVYYADLVRTQGDLVKGPQQVPATESIQRDLANVTAAWNWLVEHGRFETLVDTLLPSLFLYFASRSRGQQLVTMVDRAIRQLETEESGADPAWQIIFLTAKAAFPHEFLITPYFVVELYPPTGQELIETAYDNAHHNNLEDRLGFWSVMLAMLYGWAFDQSEAIDWLRRLVTVFREQDDTWLLAFALQNLGGLLLPSGRGRPGGQAGTAEAYQSLDEAVSLFETLGDRREKGHSMRLWGMVSRSGDFRDAKRMLLTAQQDLLSAGDPIMAAQVTMALANVCFTRDELTEGFSYYQQARSAYANLGNRFLEAGVLSWESIWALRLDTVEHARSARLLSLDIARKTGNTLDIAWGTWELAEIERIAGDHSLARHLFEEARSLFMAMSEPFGPAFYARGIGDLAYALGDYGQAQRRFEESLRLARAHSHQWLAAYALFGLGRAELALAREDAQVRQAQKRFIEGLQSAAYHRYDHLAIGLAGLAACYRAQGRLAETLQLIHVVLDSPLTWQETRAQARMLQEAILNDNPELKAVKTDGRKDPVSDLLSPVEHLLSFVLDLLAKETQ